MLQLISATPSPYARKVRIALIEKNIPFELITEVPWNSDAITPKYNPLGKLPVLLLEDGSSVYDSRFILEWLELMFPDTPLLPSSVPERLLAKQFEVLCDGVCDAVVLLFFERMRGKNESPDWSARQIRKIEGGVGEIARLVGQRSYAVGNSLSLGDISIGSALGYLSVRFKEFNWNKLYPSLEHYFLALEQRSSFKETVPYPQTISDKVV